MTSEEQVAEIYNLIGLCSTYLIAEIALSKGDPENEVPELLKEAKQMAANEALYRKHYETK